MVRLPAAAGCRLSLARANSQSLVSGSMITGFGSTLWAASRMVLLTASTGGVGEPATSASKEPITTKVAPRGGLLADRPPTSETTAAATANGLLPASL